MLDNANAVSAAEAFVYTKTRYPAWFAPDAARRRPSLLRMCAEGIVLKDPNGLAAQMLAGASALLAKGSGPLGPQELAWDRYQITDLLNGLTGAREMLFTAVALAPAFVDLSCDLKEQWRGTAKWVPRALESVDARLAARLAAAVHDAGAGQLRHLVELGGELLAWCAGRLFEEFSMGNNQAPSQSRQSRRLPATFFPQRFREPRTLLETMLLHNTLDRKPYTVQGPEQWTFGPQNQKVQRSVSDQSPRMTGPAILRTARLPS